MRHSFVIVLLFCCSASFNAHGQTHDKIDSSMCLKIIAETIRYHSLRKTETALLYAKDGVELAEKTFGSFHVIYATCLSNLAALYKATNNYSAAENLYEKVIPLRKKLLGESHPEYLTSLNSFAMLYHSMGKYLMAEPLYKEVMITRQKELGDNHPDYAASLTNLAMLYIDMANYTIAEPLLKKALQINKTILGENHLDYTRSLNSLAMLYKDMSNYNMAEALYKEVLSVRKRTLGENDTYYIMTMNDLATLYVSMGNYSLAEPLFKSALVKYKYLWGVSNSTYASILSNLAALYKDIGNYALAESLHKEALAIRKKIFGEEHPVYASSLSNLGTLYENMGNYALAESLFEKAIIIRKSSLGENHADYASSINNLAALYHSIKNYSAAENLYKQALGIRKKILGESHPDYATSLTNLGVLYSDVGNYEKAGELFKNAFCIKKTIFGVNHPNYASGLNNLAGYYKSVNNYTAAEPLYIAALSVYKNILGENHASYSSTISYLGSLYANMKNYKAAEDYYKKALFIDKKIFGENNPTYITDWNNLTYLYFSYKDIDKWKSVFNVGIEKETSSEQDLVQNLSESEKQIYLTESQIMQDFFYSTIFYFKPKAISTFYKNTTTKQGWLLQSKQQLINLANSSKDSTVISLFNQWQNTSNLYAKAIQLTTATRKQHGLNADSLQTQSQQEEKQLIAALPALQSIITNTGVSCKQVAAKLKQHEAVVHWVAFQYKAPEHWTDSTLYAAYIVTANDTAPKFVTVFEQKQLQALLKTYHSNSSRSTIQKNNADTLHSDIALYNLIWKPLLPYLKKASTVYNLPAGLLHKVSFAALTDSATNKQLVDVYEMHQLLSINELVNPLTVSTSTKTIALFGGANYNEANTSNHTGTIALMPMYRNATNNTSSFNYLPGTKTEVETVAANAKSSLWKTISYSGAEATEDNFKQLGNNAPRILHIATHGFYFPPTKTKASIGFDMENKNAPKDFPLLRSGLVLSGANNYWGKDTLLEDKEDGIVTAQEISSLNFLNTDLVVLSACQTALGDINASEGVYGLQRAFKMAGAKKLLMSLWDVPDAETAELMQLFYQSVFKGETYYNALRNAQVIMKAKYKDSTKWAGFVLVGE